MIGETDIQIGDWLHLEYTNSIQGFVSFNFKVSQLRRDYGDELLVWGEKTPDGKHFGNMGGVSKIQPIPLTAEILEKNGFEKDPESGELIWTDDDVTEIVWVGTILTIRGEYANAEFATCMFVHQLQHALRLCGIEHEITL